jgi:hypothetical protein
MGTLLLHAAPAPQFIPSVIKGSWYVVGGRWGKKGWTWVSGVSESGWGLGAMLNFEL